MAKKKRQGQGFGEKREIPTREVKDFLITFGEKVKDEGQDSEHIERFVAVKIDKFDESLLESLPEVFKREIAKQSPQGQEFIAGLFFNFGAFLYRFPQGKRWLNLELSILANNLAAKIFRRETHPEDWARTQGNSANAYSDRIKGDRAENIETAIALYQLALEIYTREDFPGDWASTQGNLALTYSYRIKGDRAENIETAIALYQLALEIYTREDFPQDWAATQGNLATAYLYRIKGDRAENIETAIALHQLALEIYTRENFPQDWARMQGNLALDYSERIRGDRAENIETAIALYQLTLEIYTREELPEHWARTHHNIANAYRENISGESLGNIETALEHYQLSAQIFTREDYPQKWGRNQSHWAEALTKRSELTANSQELDEAIAMLQEAVEVLAEGCPDFIDAQYRLGNALARRYENNQDPQDLEQAIKAYKIALDAISPEHYDRQQIWQALPTTQSVLGSRLVREGKWQEGLELLLNSVRQLRQSDDKVAYANALYQTARAHEILTDWINARMYYRDALRLFEQINNRSGIAKSHAGLGGVLVSQGHLAKGMAELSTAKDVYDELEQPQKVAEIEKLYQMAQKVSDQLLSEAF